MANRNSKLVALACAAASVSVLSGCESGSSGSTVKIHYSQIGACNGYASDTGATGKKANHAFIVFKIESLDGSQSGEAFNFEAGRLYVDLAPNKETWGSSLGAGLYFASTDARFTKPLGVPVIEDMKLPGRESATIDRLVFVDVPTADANGAAEASKISYKLSYDAVTKDTGRIPDPKIEFVKTNESQSTWPATEDCLQLETGMKK